MCAARRMVSNSLFSVLMFTVLVCALAWLVNIEALFKFYSGAKEGVLERVLPSVIYRPFAFVAEADLSTVTTLLPLLLVGIPAWVWAWHLRGVRPLPRFLLGDEAPYPNRFAAFSFWCGLFGTLIGLVIGLPDIRPDSGNAIQIQDVLSKQIVGLKTAVVSTVAGMIVAALSIVVSALLRPRLLPLESRSSVMDSVEALHREVDRLTQHLAAAAVPFNSLVQAAADLAASLQISVRHLQTIQESISVNALQRGLGQIGTLCDTTQAALDLAQRTSESLDRARQESVLRQAEQHKVIAAHLSTLVDETVQDRRTFSLGLYRMARALAPSGNGNGASTKQIGDTL